MKNIHDLIAKINLPSELFRVINKKDVAEDLSLYLIGVKILFFNNFRPYLKLNTHYHYIPDEDALIAIIKYMIHPNDRYSIKTQDVKESVLRVKDCLELQINFEDHYEDNKNYINVANGVYDINKQKLLPHNNNYCFDYCFAFSYIPKNDRKLDTYKYFVESSIGNNNEASLLNVIGYSLSSLDDVKKAIIFIGPGNSAKSKILDLIEKGIGIDYVRTNAFDQIGSEASVASYEGGIKVNLSRDVTIGKIKEDGGFKSVISCEPINGRLLYKNHTSVTPRVHFIAASNAFPQYRNPDDASLDRLTVIRVAGYKGKPDPKFPQKLFSEVDSICSEAVDVLKNFIESNYDFKLSKESLELINHEKAKLHTADSFLEECFEFDTNGYVSSVGLYNMYIDWCKRNAFEPIGKSKFYDIVKLSNSSIIYKKVPNGTSYVNGFYGLKLRTNISTCDDNYNKISNSGDKENQVKYDTDEKPQSKSA